MNYVNRSSINGLTLIEALIASSVGGMLIAGFFQVFTVYSTVGERGAALREVSVLASHLIEQSNGKDQAGQFGAYRWRIVTAQSPFAFEEQKIDRFRLVHVTVEIDGPGLERAFLVSQERILK